MVSRHYKVCWSYKKSQAFNYATPYSCDNNPQSLIALDLDEIEHCGALEGLLYL